MQEKALDLLRKVHGENHPHVATALFNLGILLCLQDKYSDAIIQIKASLDRRKIVFNETNPLLYDTMRILSYLSYLEGSYLQSRSYLEECLKIKKRNHFSLSDKCEIAILLNNLGLVLKGLLIYSEAEEILNESLKIRLESSGPSHDLMSTATGYYTVGRLYLSMRRFQEAKDYLMKSQSLCEAIEQRVSGSAPPSPHPLTANILHTLSELAESQGSLIDAISYMNDVMDIRIQLYGDGHILVVGSLYRLLTLYKLTMNDIEIEKLEQRLETHELVTSVRRSQEDYSIALLMLLDGFEDSTDGILSSNSTSQFIKMDKSKHGSFAPDDPHTSSHTNIISTGDEYLPTLVLTSGKDWTDHLLIYLTKKYEIMTQELHEKERAHHEKRALVEFRENEIISQTNLLEKLNFKEKEFENLSKFDKRYLYDLQKTQKEQEILKLKLREEEEEEGGQGGEESVKGSLNELRIEEKKHKEVVEVIEMKLQSLSQEIQSMESLNRKYKEILTRVQDMETSLTNQRQVVEKLKQEIIHREIDEEGENGHGIPQEAEGKRELSDEKESGRLKQRLYEAIHEKQAMETDYEVIQIQYFKMLSQLNAVRKKYNIPSDPLGPSLGLSSTASPPSILKHTSSTANSPPALDTTTPTTTVVGTATTVGKTRGDSFLLDDCEDMSDTDAVDADGDDPASGDSSKVTKLSKRVKKQRLLIDLLTNQVLSLGAAPIAEVVTLTSAEQRLQQSLIKLMEGDEEATKDFDKWDQFVRNHPEFKHKEELKRERWKTENTPINAMAYRLIKSLVPPEIVLSCTLVMLESQLPKPLAKRIWLKKALWLTRISPTKISKLHIADLQSKYSPQGLDEVELRAVYHALPQTFENDGKGEKVAWKNSILESLQGKTRNPLPWAEKYEAEPQYEPSSEEIVTFLLTLSRNPTYKYIPPFRLLTVPNLPSSHFTSVDRSCQSNGPYDPDAEFLNLEEASHQAEVDSSLIALRTAESVPKGSSDDLETTVADQQPTRSIMRRASIFGSSKISEKKTRAAPNLDADPKATKSNSMSNIFSEMKDPSRGLKPAKSGGGMASMMEEMKQKSLRKKSSLGDGEAHGGGSSGQ
jgi:tetratricopeptide (TPR) repeat protein